MQQLTVALLCLLACLFWAAPGGTQSLKSISGRVLDAHDSAPIAGAVVTIDATSWRTVTDEDGRFSFHGLPSGEYRLAITAEGYHRNAEVRTEVSATGTANPVVHLERSLKTLRPIRVRAERGITTSESVVVLDRSQIERTEARDLPEVLTHMPGVQVESDGSGRAHVTLRGSTSEQVLVLFDGHRLNPPSGGQADLASIPLEMIKRVEVYKESASARFGADAMAGAINIISRSSSGVPLAAELDQRVSSWNGSRSAVTVGSTGDGRTLSFNGSFTTRRNDGDFPFAYSVAPADTLVKGLRQNNGRRSDNYFVSGSANWGPGTEVNASLQVYESSRGLPGQAREQNRFARRTDDRVLVTSGLRHQLTGEVRLTARLGWSEMNQKLFDLKSAKSDRFHTEYEDRTLSEGLSLAWEPDNRWLVRLGAEGSQQRLQHRDYLTPRQSTGQTDRTTWSGYLETRRRVDLPSTLWFKRLAIDGVLRYDDATTTPEDTAPTYPWESPRRSVTVSRWTPRTGITLTGGEALKTTVRISHGSSFRLPSINALFWKGDARSSGNPDLRPEVMLSTNWGGSLRYNHGWFGLEAGVTWFHRKVEDLVQWVQSGPSGVWKPVNLGSARIAGREDYVRATLWKERVSIDYQNTLVEARNRVPGPNSFDNYLTHRPRYSTRLAIALRVDPVRIEYSSRLVGRRWATEANTKWYDGYRLDELHLSARIPVSSSWALAGDVAVKNLLDEHYVIITHHPMPGRNWRAGVAISYNPVNEEKH
jgi:outer membrane cobalamin receptor